MRERNNVILNCINVLNCDSGSLVCAFYLTYNYDWTRAKIDGLFIL